MSDTGFSAICPKDILLPIIIVPGIMGTRLENSEGEAVWDADNTIKTAITYLFASPRRLKQLLVGPAGHDPDYLRPIQKPRKDHFPVYTDWGNATELGWGGPIWSGYRQAFEFIWPANINSKLSTDAKARCGDLNQAPVFGAGYNWTTSNLTSGEKLAEQITAIHSKAEAYAAEHDLEYNGIVLLTHSMGGLVARAATLLNGVEDKVLGVLSVAMPTDGAPAAYKRFIFGFEGGDYLPKEASFLERLVSGVTSSILGSRGEKTTATLAYMPGAQELLPNKIYKTNQGETDWLRINNPDGSQLLSLPQGGDPYTEIYQKQDVLYEMVEESWLFPISASADDLTTSEFDAFSEINKDAAFYHDQVQSAGDFFDPTYLHHTAMDKGEEDDEFGLSHPSWDKIEWTTKSDKTLSLDDINQDYNERGGLIFGFGEKRKRSVRASDGAVIAKIAPGNAMGDGTVPASAQYFARVPDDKKTPTGAGNGYEHAAALGTEIPTKWIVEKITELINEKV